MFYSIYNPNNKIHVYCTSHNKLQLIKGLSISADPRENYCGLVVHDANLHTTIRKGMIEIRPPSTFVDNGGTEG